MTCSVPGCQNGVHSRGLCSGCYGRLRRTGTLERRAPAVQAEDVRTVADAERDLERTKVALANLPWRSPEIATWCARKRELVAEIEALKNAPKEVQPRVFSLDDEVRARMRRLKTGQHNPRFNAAIPWGEVRRLFESGMSVVQIAAKFGVSRCSARYRLRSEMKQA